MVRKKTNDIEKVNKKEEHIDIDNLKIELNKYIDEVVKKEFTAELERANKRLLREKNIKIITKNMVITLLLLVIVYLVYILNDNNYFDKFFIDDDNRIISKNNYKENQEEVSLDDLKKEYSYLLDNIYVSENCNYIEDYYAGNLSIELKNYLTLNTINLDSISNEDSYSIIDEKIFKNQYKKIFSGEYNNKSFKYNDNNIRYISKLDSYISDDIINKIDSNIKREIIDIIIDDKITIVTVEGLVLDNKIYNIINKEEVGEYNNNLLDYSDNLNKVKYIFDNSDRLISID